MQILGPYIIKVFIVCFRFTSWHHHHRCSPGGSSGLCHAGRSVLVCIQEECGTFSWATYHWQCLLQTNQFTGNRVGWKCADHRLRGSLRRVAPNVSVPHYVAIRWKCPRHCKAVLLTPQDSCEIMSVSLSLRDSFIYIRISQHQDKCVS